MTGVTCHLLCEDYLIKHPDGYRITQFKYWYNEFSKEVSLVMHLNNKAGGLRYDSASKKGVDCIVMNYLNGVQLSVICNSIGPETFPINPKLRDAFDDAWD